MITGLVVLKIVLTPSRHRLASLANSGPRWSMIGVSIARSTRSGSGVGPGMCRKWRPTGREEFFDITQVPCRRGFSSVDQRRPPPGRGLPPSRTKARGSQASCDAGADLPTGREGSGMAQTVVPGLERRLKAHLLGEVQFDAFTRGRYATDASHYQIMPLGVVAPRSVKEAEYALALVREEGVSVLPRGAGTSQAGQTVNSSLVIDCSKYLDHLIELDVPGRRCVVEPGIVLDELNRRLRPHGLWFPVDISTSSRATIGGMVGNNSCGARSLRYGNTRENVLSIDAVLADGSVAHF